MDAFDKLSRVFEDAEEKWKMHPTYYLAEPWDVGERSKAVYDQAELDNVDLHSADLTRAAGAAPHGFQTDYLLSDAFGRVILSAGQVGKSWTVLMEILITATGEIPLSLRYPAGEDTGIPRLINRDNIVRWGRRSKDTGEVLDHNINAIDDGSWDCGNVTGVGVFPQNKIVPAGSMIRLASYDALINQVWWPALTGEKKVGLAQFVPPFFIDRSHAATQGVHTKGRYISMLRDVRLQIITYEARKKSFEGEDAPSYCDEEPPDEELLSSMWGHTNRWSLSETPWRGITYSKKLAFPEKSSHMRKTFHATLYDCPYKTEQDRLEKRAEMEDKPWEIAARVWGIPTDVAGKPYYDRMKINLWMQKYAKTGTLTRFEPAAEWDGVKDNPYSSQPPLLKTPIRPQEVDVDDKQATWRVYEERKDGVAYGIGSDQAEGVERVQDVGDWSAACVVRKKEGDPTHPIVCATLRSSLPAAGFTREVMYAARLYNNAMLIPESGKGSANATFMEAAKDWPWFFKDTVERWSTRKPKENLGFCPTPDRRETMWDKLVRDWLDSYSEEDYPDIPDEQILTELAGAIVGHTNTGKKARCDHPSDGFLDMATAWGICLFASQPEFVHQWHCNGGPALLPRPKTWLELADEVAEREKGDLTSEKWLGEDVPSMR